MSIASPIKWHGGKTYLAPKLIPLLPKHVHRVHPYAGGLSELFAWPCEGVSEVVNDLNFDLTNFWCALQSPESFEDFRRRVEAVPFSQIEFDGANQPYDSTGGMCSHAVNFFIRCRQSRQGLQKDFATLSRNRIRRGMNEQASAWLTSVEGLPEVHERLKRVVVLNADAIKVIRQQDGEHTFFYCDPPYLHETRETTSDYQHEMTPAQHEALLMTLGSIEGKFMLSGYPSEMYSDAAELYGWRVRDFDLPNNASGKKSKERKIERVWMNYVV